MKNCLILKFFFSLFLSVKKITLPLNLKFPFLLRPPLLLPLPSLPFPGDFLFLIIGNNNLS